MIFKNTMKIVFSNFGISIKSCLYKMLCLALILLLGYGILSPVIDACMNIGLLQNLSDFFAKGILAFDSEVVVGSFSNILDICNTVMAQNVGFTWNLVIIALITVVILPIVLGLSKVAECSALFHIFSSRSSVDFMTCYFENLKKGFVYRCYRLLFSIPVFLVCLFVVFFIPLYIFKGTLPFLAFAVISFVVLLICSLFMTYFLIFEPNIVIQGGSPVKALKASMKNVKDYGFFKVFGIMCLLSLVAFLINGVFASFTYGISLIITLPITIHFSNILRMILCYEILGMNYYISKKSVCVTKKKAEKINMDKMKNLI